MWLTKSQPQSYCRPTLASALNGSSPRWLSKMPWLTVRPTPDTTSLSPPRCIWLGLGSHSQISEEKRQEPIYASKLGSNFTRVLEHETRQQEGLQTSTHQTPTAAFMPHQLRQCKFSRPIQSAKGSKLAPRCQHWLSRRLDAVLCGWDDTSSLSELKTGIKLTRKDETLSPQHLHIC